MNFTFMIYILLAIMIYISLKKNIKIPFVYFCIGLVVVLVLNEIYNYSDYTKSEQFDNEWSKYKYNKDFNPYDYYPEFKNIKIPFKYDSNLEQGLICKPQADIYKNLAIKKKLDLQDAYANQFLNFVQGKPLTLEEGEDDIFLPITDEMLSADKKCPSVCHLITNKDKCDNEREIPVFSNENEYDMWNDQVDDCDRLTRQVDCDGNDKCNYNTVDTTCYSKDNLRKCLSFRQGYNNKRTTKNLLPKYNNKEVKIISYNAVGNNYIIEFKNGERLTVAPDKLIETAECFTRCKYLNDSNTSKAKLNCESAVLSNGENYCEWKSQIFDGVSEYYDECRPICKFYRNQELCDSDEHCNYNATNGTCEER